MTDKLRFTIMGCGSSPGVPRINGDWGACDPKEPKNKRLRCSLLVERITEKGATRIVIDTSPDFRVQMLNADVASIDAVLYTHPHADHVHGIDDLRGYALAMRKRVPVFADEETAQRLLEGFGYCFQSDERGLYPAILELNSLKVGEPVDVRGEGGSIFALPVLQTHGPIHSLGFRFSTNEDFSNGGLCYSSDCSDIPETSWPDLQKLDVWIVDGLQYKPHISHFSVSDAIEWSKRFAPKSTILTHMHIPLDYQTLKQELPAGIAPAFDGMVMEV